MLIILRSLLSRYNIDAHAVEFLADDSKETYWQSPSGISPVSIQLHLSSKVDLSKIFISFESPLPPSVRLDYYSPEGWSPLQYWADDCNKRFAMENDRK